MDGGRLAMAADAEREAKHERWVRRGEMGMELDEVRRRLAEWRELPRWVLGAEATINHLKARREQLKAGIEALRTEDDK